MMSAYFHIFFIALAILALASSATLVEERKLSRNVKESKMHRFEFDNGTYEVSDSSGDWYFAKNDCASRGMELVSIESLEEQQAIIAEISAYNEPFWTSGSDHTTQTIFYWESTGRAMGPFTYWAPGEPKNIENLQDCVHMDNLDSYMWHDLDCTGNPIRYICEKRGQVADENIDFSFGNVNYKISSLKLDWWKAKFDCRMKGMRLVSIESAAENEAIRQGVRAFDQLDNFWLSATDLGVDGDFYWDSTGEYFSSAFNDWMEGEPALGTKDHHCAHMSGNWSDTETHRWKIANCYSPTRYICETPTSKNLESDVEKMQDTNLDSLTSFAFRTSTYEISEIKVNWYLAKLDCKVKGMELISIESLEEQDALVNQIGALSEDFWTSGNAEGLWKHGFIWDSTGRLYWQYTNWATGQPNSELSPGNCIILSHADGFKWIDDGCKSDLRYICEKKDSIEDEVIKFNYNNTYYEAGTNSLSWWDANRECRSKGMRLVSIHSAGESDAITFIFTQLDKAWVLWTSGVDFRNNDKFNWDSTGENIGSSYTNWAGNEPSENCVTLRFDGTVYKWATEDCDLLRVYLCESPE